VVANCMYKCKRTSRYIGSHLVDVEIAVIYSVTARFDVLLGWLATGGSSCSIQ